MNKKISLIIMGALMLGLVGAYTISQVITQEQLDNQNLTSSDLNEHFLRDENNKVFHERIGDREYFYVVTDTIQKQMSINETDNSSYWSGDYIIVNQTFPVIAKVSHWKEMADNIGLENATKQLKIHLKNRRDKIVAREKEKIAEWQTQNNMDGFNLGDMDLTGLVNETE